MRKKRRSPSVLVGFAVAIAVGGAAALAAEAPVPSLDAQESWGVADCAECHEEEVNGLSRSHHGVLDSKGWAALAGAESSCVACHGDPSEHIEQDGDAPIFAFSAEEFAVEKTQRCQTCHSKVHPRFQFSSHAKAGLDCVTCHTVHGKETDDYRAGIDFVGRTSSLCSECHQDVFSDFTFNERHRLQERILECTSCHNPHEPATRVLLGGFKQEQCVECHTDKGGPFVFEHGSVKVEGCVACHSPHGAPNRHQLHFQSVAELCYSCHAFVPGFHARFTVETVCISCHSSIHGSNLHPFFLK